MGCTLEVALLSVKTRELDENVQFDPCQKRIYPGDCSGEKCVVHYHYQENPMVG